MRKVRKIGKSAVKYVLCREMQELVGDRKGTDGVCAGPHDYNLSLYRGIFTIASISR